MLAAWVALFDMWPGRKSPCLSGRHWPAVASELEASGQKGAAYALRSRGLWEAAALLDDERLLSEAGKVISQRAQAGWSPITPFEKMPPRLVAVLSSSCPPLFWAKGELDGLERKAAGIVGGRHLSCEEAKFASAAGALCAELGLSVFSGGAQGADSFGAAGARLAGGFAAHFHPGGKRRAEETILCRAIDAPYFDRIEALARNKWIYAAADSVLIVSSRFNEGGSWAGAIAAKRARLSDVIVFMAKTPSSGNQALALLGAKRVSNIEELRSALAKPREESLRFAI